MFTQSLAFSSPLPSPFNKPRSDTTDHPQPINQYIIQLTIPSSSEPSSTTEPASNRSGKTKSSIMVWAGIGRLKKPHSAPNGNGKGKEEMNAYEKALAEEMEMGSEAVPEFESLSRKLGEDWACAIPTTLKGNPVASSTLMNGIEADVSSGTARSSRARGMAERLSKRFHSQIILSLDIPPSASLLSSMESSLSSGRSTMMGGGPGGGLPGLDPLGEKVYLGLEKALVRVLEGALIGRE